MATITTTDFNNILNEHGVDAVLRVKDDTQGSTTQSLFDSIYGSALTGGNSAGPSGFIERPLFSLFQFVTGDEQWAGSIGDLTVGDAVIFTRAEYQEGTVFYRPQVGNWIAYDGRVYEVVQVIPNQTSGNVIFLEVHAKYSSAQA